MEQIQWRDDIPDDIYQRIWDLAVRDGLSGPAVRKALLSEFADREHQIPPLRTLQRMIRALVGPLRRKSQDGSGPWGPAEMSGSDVALVMEVLVEHRRSAPRAFRWPSRELAVRIAWIRSAAPTLPLGAVLPFARTYNSDPGSRAGIHWVLGYRPWENERSWNEYHRALHDNDKVVPHIPGSLHFHMMMGVEWRTDAMVSSFIRRRNIRDESTLGALANLGRRAGQPSTRQQRGNNAV